MRGRIDDGQVSPEICGLLKFFRQKGVSGTIDHVRIFIAPPTVPGTRRSLWISVEYQSNQPSCTPCRSQMNRKRGFTRTPLLTNDCHCLHYYVLISLCVNTLARLRTSRYGEKRPPCGAAHRAVS